MLWRGLAGAPATPRHVTYRCTSPPPPTPDPPCPLIEAPRGDGDD
jgi:hypothetical protein